MNIEEIIKILNDNKKAMNTEVYLAIQGSIKRYLKNNGIKYSKEDLDILTHEAYKLID